MDYSLLGIGLRDSFRSEGFTVDEIPLQGEVFRLLIRQSKQAGSAGVEIYMEKNIPVLIYVANVALHENLSKYHLLSPDQKFKFTKSLDELLKKQSLTEYEIIDDGKDFSVRIQCNIVVPYREIRELTENFDNINIAGNAVIDFMRSQFRKS